jgi:hypothetical protein
MRAASRPVGQIHEHADPPHLLALLRRDASGHAAIAPPRSVINSRRRISAPKLGTSIVSFL